MLTPAINAATPLKIAQPRTETNPNGGGQPINARRQHYARDFGISKNWARRLLTEEAMDTLDRCADDSARRVLLGVGERF